MNQLLSHYAQTMIVFVTVVLIFALLFAVLPKDAWTNAFCEKDGTAAGSAGNTPANDGTNAGTSGNTPANDGTNAGTSGNTPANDAASPLSDIHASTPAPKPGISNTPVTVGVPVALTGLITAEGQSLSAAGSRYSVTLHEAVWLGTDGDMPDGMDAPGVGTGQSEAVCTGGAVTFLKPGIYRIRVTVGDTNGLATTAYLYCHAQRKGFA